MIQFNPIHPLEFLKSFENGDTLGIHFQRGCSCLHFPTLRSSGQGSDAFSLRVGLQVAKWFAQAKHCLQLESNGTVMISYLNRIGSRWSISISDTAVFFVACHAFVLCREPKHLQYILSYSANKERICKQVVITFSPFFVTSW